MLRTYLRELKSFVEVQQGGDGHPASYCFTAALPSELASGLLPGCFRAEIAGVNTHPAPNPAVTAKNFRAEHLYPSSVSSSFSNHSQSTTVENSPAPAKTDSTESYTEVERQTLMRHIRHCGFDPSSALMEKRTKRGLRSGRERASPVRLWRRGRWPQWVS